MKNKYTPIFVIAVICSILAALFRNYVLSNEANLIIVKGVKKYRQMASMSNTFIIIALIATAAAAGLTIYSMIQNKNAIKEQRDKELETERKELEEKKEKESYLSASNQLKEDVIRDKLLDEANGEWNILDGEIRTLWTQSMTMDEFQSKLKELIISNNASVLNDAEEVLSKAEQNLLNNIRKVMNYMSICDAKTQDGINKVEEQAKLCYSDNTVILDNVKNFLISLTEYLNNQGSNDSLETLNAYKDALSGAATTSPVKSDSAQNASAETATASLKF